MPDEIVEAPGEARGDDHHPWTYPPSVGENDVGAVERDDCGDDIDRSPLQCEDKTDVQNRNAPVVLNAGDSPWSGRGMP